MSNKDAPFGFQCFNEVLRARIYAVPTAPTINICVGDIVLNDNGGTVSPKFGLIPSVYDAAVPPATPGDAQKILGVVLSCFDEDMNPLENAPSGYIAAARAGDGTVAGYVLVADHPSQQMIAQADAALTAADINLNYEIGSVALCAPDSNTGLSTQEITVTGAAVTVTIPLRLYGQSHPLEDVYSAAGCRMVCGFNHECHYFGAGLML
jgi:hypothetical protein